MSIISKWKEKRLEKEMEREELHQAKVREKEALQQKEAELLKKKREFDVEIATQKAEREEKLAALTEEKQLQQERIKTAHDKIIAEKHRRRDEKLEKLKKAGRKLEQVATQLGILEQPTKRRRQSPRRNVRRKFR